MRRRTPAHFRHFRPLHLCHTLNFLRSHHRLRCRHCSQVRRWRLLWHWPVPRQERNSRRRRMRYRHYHPGHPFRRTVRHHIPNHPLPQRRRCRRWRWQCSKRRRLSQTHWRHRRFLQVHPRCRWNPAYPEHLPSLARCPWRREVSQLEAKSQPPLSTVYFVSEMLIPPWARLRLLLQVGKYRSKALIKGKEFCTPGESAQFELDRLTNSRQRPSRNFASFASSRLTNPTCLRPAQLPDFANHAANQFYQVSSLEFTVSI
jgi:hypothetical protein